VVTKEQQVQQEPQAPVEGEAVPVEGG
jgi:hypothetical protein